MNGLVPSDLVPYTEGEKLEWSEVIFMRKQLNLIYIAVLLLCFVLVGCSPKTTLTGDMAKDGKSYSIVADNTDEGDMMMVGTLIVDEGEKAVITSALEGSSAINIYLVSTDSANLSEDASEEELAGAVGNDDASFAIPVSGTTSMDCFAAPGEYYVRVVAGTSMSGTVDIAVKPFEDFDSWTKVETPEEAAEGAGFSTFHGGVSSYTNSGITYDEAYYFQDGKAMAALSLGDFMVYSIKSDSPVNDPAADEKAYKYNLEKDVNAVPMTMYGDGEDELNKAVWQKGDNNYCVIAYKDSKLYSGMTLLEVSTIASSVD